MVFKVSRSGYYNWLTRKPSLLVRNREHISEKVEIIFHQSKGRYGSPKIAKEPKSQGLYASRLRVARIMKKKGHRGFIMGKLKFVRLIVIYNLEVSENLLIESS
ncbi:IS3 family transposase [Chitinophaga sancti]